MSSGSLCRFGQLGWHGSVWFQDLRSLNTALERVCSLDSSINTEHPVAMKPAVMYLYLNLQDTGELVKQNNKLSILYIKVF